MQHGGPPRLPTLRNISSDSGRRLKPFGPFVILVRGTKPSSAVDATLQPATRPVKLGYAGVMAAMASSSRSAKGRAWFESTQVVFAAMRQESAAPTVAAARSRRRMPSAPDLHPLLSEEAVPVRRDEPISIRGVIRRAPGSGCRRHWPESTHRSCPR